VSRQGSVGVFDSGVGGLSVWREIVSRLAHEDVIYLADQAHVPYGFRPLEQVKEFAEAVVRFLLEQGAKIIVVACNTISAAALYYLRNVFPDVPFVGMEPAIKPAVERTRSGVVGVIATQATFQGKLFASLVERYVGDVQELCRVCPGLVEAVEAGALDGPEAEGLLRECLEPLVSAGVDQLVLGCTHYPFLRSTIERIVGEGVAVIDPAPAVACQAERVLQSRGLVVEGPRPARHLFYTSGSEATFAAMLLRLLELDGEEVEVREVGWQAGRLRLPPE
jgi:glutamate racemase